MNRRLHTTYQKLLASPQKLGPGVQTSNLENWLPKPPEGTMNDEDKKLIEEGERVCNLEEDTPLPSKFINGAAAVLPKLVARLKAVLAERDALATSGAVAAGQILHLETELDLHKLALADRTVALAEVTKERDQAYDELGL